MSETEEQILDADVQDSTSEQSQEKKDQSDSPSSDFVETLQEAIDATEEGEQEEQPEAKIFSDSIPQEHEGIVDRDFFNQDTTWQATVLGELPNGKTLQVMKRKEGTGYYLAYREGMKVPHEINGWFTTYDKAESTGRTFMNQQWDQDAETGSS